jgi:DNA polymerase III delta subunit
MGRTIAAVFVGDYRLASESIDKVSRMFFGDSEGQTVPASSISGVEEELTTPPICGGRRIVLVESALMSDELASLLLRLSEAPIDCCMALCHVNELSHRCESVLKKAKDNTVRIMHLGVLRGFEDASNFVEQRVAAKGGKIDWKATRMLVSVVGHDDVSSLISEIDKLLFVSDSHVTEEAVSLYSYGGASKRFFHLYTSLGDGDFKTAISEVNDHVNEMGAEAVDMAICKLLTISCRVYRQWTGNITKIHKDRLNSHWWEDGSDSSQPIPSRFMVDCASNIVNRIGGGVQSLVKEAVSDFPLHRYVGMSYPVERLYLKVAAICFGKKKDGYDVLHWHRPVSDGNRIVRLG